MADRGYTLIDFTGPPGLWPDRDRVVRFMEYIRANLGRIIPGLPAECEADLFASGHPHNPGLVPLLGLWAPEVVRDRVPDQLWMIDVISEWCAALSAGEVDAIVTAMAAPTWEELVRVRVHPARRHDA